MSQHNTRKPHAEPLATPHQAQPRLTSEAALVAEIASRLLDLGGLKGGAWVHRYLTRISAIAQRPSALALYCHAQADDDHSRGLSDEAAERGVTRQAIHAERSLDIAFIGRIEPQLALDLKAHYSRRMQAVEHRRPTQKP